jgi:hypothetical protein
MKSSIQGSKNTKSDQLSQSEPNSSGFPLDADENVADIYNLDSWVENKKSSRLP